MLSFLVHRRGDGATILACQAQGSQAQGTLPNTGFVKWSCLTRLVYHAIGPLAVSFVLVVVGIP